MKIARGEVVLVDFPFASGAGRKLRPAVVVQSDANNRRLQTTILAPITSNLGHISERTQVAVDPATAGGSTSGLLRPSSVKCENLTTIETNLVRRKIGVLSASLIDELDRAIKAAVGIR